MKEGKWWKEADRMRKQRDKETLKRGEGGIGIENSEDSVDVIEIGMTRVR